METIPAASRPSVKLAEVPITLPGSPFWNVFRRFGRDEMIAMIINTAGTIIVSLLTHNALLIAAIGPIIEKIGFFPAHCYEAYKVFSTTNPKNRLPFGHYFKKALKSGGTSLTEDILIHDPLYILLMWGGLTIYPTTPAWLLAMVSFAVAIVLVAWLEVAWTEAEFWWFKYQLKKIGFEVETYFESRFFISAEANPEEVIARLAQTFNLSTIRTLDYEDTYYQTTISSFSGRVPKIRLRRRSASRGAGTVQTAQIVFTRAQEFLPKEIGQYRFFPIKKEKIYTFIAGEMPSSVSEIENPQLSQALTRMTLPAAPLKVEFARRIAFNHDLVASADLVAGEEPFYLLEIKSHRNIATLIAAMRWVMHELPVVQTTLGKVEILQ